MKNRRFAQDDWYGFSVYQDAEHPAYISNVTVKVTINRVEHLAIVVADKDGVTIMAIPVARHSEDGPRTFFWANKVYQLSLVLLNGLPTKFDDGLMLDLNFVEQ